MSNRLDDIEARLTALESAIDTKPAIRFHSSWRDGVAYPAASVVQRAGSLYIALTAVEAGILPGEHADDDTRSPWRLVSRRGRDGRDGIVPPDLERRIKRLEQQS